MSYVAGGNPCRSRKTFSVAGFVFLIINMNMNMKKYIVLSLATILIFVASISFTNAENGNPFQAVWNAITFLQEQVANIELTPGPEGPKGDTGEQGLPGTQLHVFDANNQDLGIYIESSFEVYNEELDAILVLKNDFEEGVPVAVHDPYPAGIKFTEENCQGIIFLSSTGHGASLMKVYNHDPLTSPLYQPNTGETPISRTAKSESFDDEDGCRNIPDQTQALTISMHEVIMPFTEPLAWPLRVDVME